nr:probable protein arginine N-methyltransferase 6.1 [Leptinotarsa decemlineata]
MAAPSKTFAVTVIHHKVAIESVCSIHRLMLEDSERNKSYRNAILNNKDEFCGKVVLDVGAGSGILSVFCAQAGAKTVYAVEASNVYKIAEEVVKENSFENVIKKQIFNLNGPTDIEDVTNLIFADTDDDLVIDDSDTDEEEHVSERDNESELSGESNAEDEADSSNEAYIAHLKKNVIHCKVEQLDLPEKVDIIVSEWMGFYLLHEAMLDSVIVARDKFLKQDGICLWFTCNFPSKFSEPVILSTEPESPPSHWKQTTIVLPTNIQVEESTPMAYDLLLRRSSVDKRKYTIEVTMLDPSEVEHPEYCLCHLTKCILVRAMLEKYEKDDMERSENK